MKTEEHKLISRKVKKFYEQNPYPGLDDNLMMDSAKKLSPYFDKPGKILFPGCGTGQQLVNVIGYQNSKIVAVDLSLTSLAYAKRKIEEIGYKNVEFIQEDILNLKNLNRKFDVIECVGTLHHMKDPLTGLKVLLDLLEPHGFLKLGLYSEIARQHIVCLL